VYLPVRPVLTVAPLERTGIRYFNIKKKAIPTPTLISMRTLNLEKNAAVSLYM
jgi:hypothetical protein